MAFRKSSSGGKISSPIEYGDKGIGQGKKPGTDFRKSSKSGSIKSPVEFGSKGMPSGMKVTHNRPAVLD
jgi:hypothetical protein